MKFPVLVALVSFSLASFAEQNRPPIAQQVAVLFTDDRGTFAWPIMTLPKDGKDMAIGKFGGYECNLDEKVCDQILKKCSDTWSDDAMKPCPIRKSAVMAYHGMADVPKMWFGSSGATFTVTSGVIVPFAFGQGTEDLVGFFISRENSNGDQKREPGVLTDQPEALRPMTVISPLSKDWLAIGYERIAKWKEQELRSCSGETCKSVSKLAAKYPLNGKVITYQLSKGRILQYFRATTSVPKERKTWPPAENSIGDYLIVEFWRLKNKGGNWVDLQSDHRYELGIKPEYVECASQCLFEWAPEVVEVGSRTFVVGKGGGGTIFGYYFFEVVDSTLKFIGDYTGGS